MNFGRRSVDEGPKLNLTPLIDIVFLLLIFFMVTTQFVDDGGLKLTLPQAAATKTQSDVRLVLSVDSDGRYFLGNKQVDGELADALAGWLPASEEDKKVLLKADGLASHQAVISAMDALARNGVTDVRIASVNK